MDRQVPSPGPRTPGWSLVSLLKPAQKQCLRRSLTRFKQSLSSSDGKRRKAGRGRRTQLPARQRQRRLKGSAGGLLAAGGQAGTGYLASWGRAKTISGSALSPRATPRALERPPSWGARNVPWPFYAGLLGRARAAGTVQYPRCVSNQFASQVRRRGPGCCLLGIFTLCVKCAIWIIPARCMTVMSSSHKT